MRKVINILSIVTLLSAAVSCVKSDRIYDNSRSEIDIDPVMSVMSKAIVSGTGYPVDVPFGVFATYSSNPAGEWTSGPVQSYLENEKFIHKGDNKYGGEQPAYWPLSGSLVFAGYSPYYPDSGSVSATFDAETKILSISNFVSDGQTDLMYFLPEVSDDKLVGLNSGASSVPAAFSHALTLLEFNIKGIEGDEPVRLKKISIASGKWYSTGDFTVTAGGNPKWENVQTAVSDLVIYSSASGNPITTTPFSVSGLVIPGETENMEANAMDITIDYEVNAVQTYQKSGTVETSTWVIGKKYIYDITIASGFIVVNPSVGNYTEVDGPDPEI